MKRLVVLTVLCGTIFCACTADKNRGRNNLPTGSSIDSSSSGTTSSVTGSGSEDRYKNETRPKSEVITKNIIDTNGKKQKMKIRNVNTKDKGEWMGWMNSSAEYSQVSDGHYYYVRKKDNYLYTLYHDKGEEVGDFHIPDGWEFDGCGRYDGQFYVFTSPEEGFDGYQLAVVDFSQNETRDLGYFPGESPDMILYHENVYGYVRLYLDEGALLEVRDITTGSRREAVVQTKRDPYSVDGSIKGDCIMDGGLYFAEMQEDKKLQFFRRDLESGTEEKIFEYTPKKDKSLGKCWDGAMEVDQEGIFFRENRDKGIMLYFVPWSGNKMQEITPKAVTDYTYNSQYVFYMDDSFQLHRWNRETKKEEKVIKTPIKDDFTMDCTEEGVYIQELSEYSYPLYYLDIKGERIETIWDGEYIDEEWEDVVVP